ERRVGCPPNPPERGQRAAIFVADRILEGSIEPCQAADTATREDRPQLRNSRLCLAADVVETEAVLARVAVHARVIRRDRLGGEVGENTQRDRREDKKNSCEQTTADGMQ